MSSQIVDNFDTGNYLDFNSHAPSTQTGAGIIGGRRVVSPFGSAGYIAGASTGYFQAGAFGPGSFSYSLNYGAPMATPLNVSLPSGAKFVIDTESVYFVNPVLVSITITDAAGKTSTSPVKDVGAPALHNFPLAEFSPAVDLSHITGIAVNYLPVTIPAGKNAGVSFDAITLVS